MKIGTERIADLESQLDKQCQVSIFLSEKIQRLKNEIADLKLDLISIETLRYHPGDYD